MRLLLTIAALLSSLTAQAASTVITNVGSMSVQPIITNSVTRGLVQWLDGETVTWTSGNPTNTDKSGLGNHGGLVNFTKTNSFIGGGRGQGFSFAGSAGNDHVQCGSGASLDDMTNGMTLSFWMRTPATTLGYVYMKGAGAGGKRLWLSNGYPLRMTWFVDTDGTDFTCQNNGFIWTNQTLHVAMTWDGTMTSNSVLFYLNGMLSRPNSVTPGTGNIVSDAANNVTWGGYASDGSFAGMLDEMRIYTNILTQAEVISLYQEGLTLPKAPNTWSNQTWAATVFMNLNDQTPGNVIGTNLLTQVSVGITNTSWAWSFSGVNPSHSNIWTVADIGSLPLINPVTSGGMTYTQQTRAFAFQCQSGAIYNGWACTLPTTPPAYSNLTVTTYFKSTRTYKSGQTGGHDIMDIGANNNQFVSQVDEDLNFWMKGHSVSNAVSIGGYRNWFYSGYWYQMVLCWDTEHGLGHRWVRTCDDWPVPSERRQVVGYSLSTLPSNTNASYWALPNNTHGMFGDGTNYSTGWAVFPGLATQLGLTMRTNYTQ